MITFAMIGYCLASVPFMTMEEGPKMLIEEIGEISPMLAWGIGALFMVIGVFISMLVIKSLWNRMFTRVCRWKEINLAESYALTIFAAMLLFTVEGF